MQNNQKKFGGKSPKNYSGEELTKFTESKKKENNLIPDNEIEFQKLNDHEWVNKWINAETIPREKEYFKVKKILVVSAIGVSFNQMVERWQYPKDYNLELDPTLKFISGKTNTDNKKNMLIVKAIENENDENYIDDRLMALIIWDLPGYENVYSVIPLSFADTRCAIILMLNCLEFKHVSEALAFKFVINHYNNNYTPSIKDDHIKKLRKLYDEACGHQKNRDLNFYCKENLSRIYVNKGKRFLIFKEKGDVAVMDEDDIIENPFLQIKDEEVNNLEIETVSTQFSNKDLIQYDYSKKHIGPRTFLGKNRKKAIKLKAMEDKMCIRETLK